MRSTSEPETLTVVDMGWRDSPATGASRTGLNDLILIIRHRFTGDAGKAHVAAKGCSDYPDGISTDDAFRAFLVTFQCVLQRGGDFLAVCPRIGFEMKLDKVLERNRFKDDFHQHFGLSS